MRALGDKLRERLGHPIVIENRPGGMQNIGARACQDSAPDGYTICIVNADPMIYNQFLIKDLPFDPVHGLAPITKLCQPLDRCFVFFEFEPSHQNLYRIFGRRFHCCRADLSVGSKR